MTVLEEKVYTVHLGYPEAEGPTSGSGVFRTVYSIDTSIDTTLYQS
jgi:hypothetical protein